MSRSQDLSSQIGEMRSQGLSDSLIAEELKNNGYSSDQVNQAMMQVDYSPSEFRVPSMAPSTPSASEGSDIYSRMEEIAENLIDEKWDQLIGEVKKVIEWKERMEEEIMKLQSDLEKMKEDFKILHQGVLGKLEDYDTRMRDVGTELKAVGKVFKDVVPEFVENVKELKSITQKKNKP